MKRIIFFTMIMVLSGSLAGAQTCPVNTLIEQEYHFDAELLSLREMNADEFHPYHDSINIPDSLIGKYLGYLSAVFDMGTEESDSVFLDYSIHVFPNVSYCGLHMAVDTNYSWIAEYLNDSLISGNTEFDSLTALYGFRLQWYYHFNSFTSMDLYTEQVLNINALINVFEAFEGISEVGGNGWAGDGDDIRIREANDTANIDFSYGWMDCPAGCIFRYHWNFSVEECDARFNGSYGNPYTLLESNEIRKDIIFPNPTSGILHISNPEAERLEIKVFSAGGTCVVNSVNFSGEIDVSSLTPGIYFLHINNIEGHKRYKFLKR